MIKKLSVYISKTTDPYENIATEEYLTFHTEPGECILFLWQNAHTVVIGRNQNCWKECRVTELEADGGFLARRLSGGGAVYHDLGNLNFTFCLKKEDADVAKQMQVIIEAAASFGLAAANSGRNDAVVDGRKFSGNAFYDSHGCYYHHGTLLIGVDGAAMSRFLNPSKAKLASKGVESVRARVVNLSELSPAITVDAMKLAMQQAFAKVYALPATPLAAERLDWDTIHKLAEKFSSWEWKYGQKIPFTDRISRCFAWGEAELALKVSRGLVEEALLSSDAMEAQWFDGIGPQFQSCPYAAAPLCDVLRRVLSERKVPASVQEELCEMLHEEI